MFLHECILHSLAVAKELEGRIAADIALGVDPDQATKTVYSYSIDIIHRLHRSTHYWLEVEQARHFQDGRFTRQGIPRLPHEATFIEFNGLLKFNYTLPIIHSNLLAEEGLAGKTETAYRGVLITRHPMNKYSNLPRDVQCYQAVWFEPIRQSTTDSNRLIGDFYNVTWSDTSWPNILADVLDQDERDCFIQGITGGGNTQIGFRESLPHARRLFRMTANLLYYLTAENLTFVRVKPGDRTKGIPRSTTPYLIRPIQYPRYRYLIEGSSKGKETKQKVRYSVRGHFRHLTDERFERNSDGTVRVIWIEEHERGLENVEYRASVRAGRIGANILDFDRFQQMIEARIRHKEQRRVDEGIRDARHLG